jgi:hypothetical protein
MLKFKQIAVGLNVAKKYKGLTFLHRKKKFNGIARAVKRCLDFLPMSLPIAVMSQIRQIVVGFNVAKKYNGLTFLHRKKKISTALQGLSNGA